MRRGPSTMLNAARARSAGAPARASGTVRPRAAAHREDAAMAAPHGRDMAAQGELDCDVGNELGGEVGTGPAAARTGREKDDRARRDEGQAEEQLAACHLVSTITISTMTSAPN